MPAKTTMPVADIILTVTDFRNVLNTRARDRGTQHTMRVRTTDPEKVKLVKDASELKNPDTPTPVVRIRGKKTLLRFSIKSSKQDGIDNVYYPIGIAFQARNSNGTPGASTCDPLGRVNFEFDGLRLKGRQLKIVDTFSEQCSCCDGSYKFSVFIQRQDGEIGIIDPTIQHEK